MVIAAHQAPNWNNPHKWTETKIILEGMRREYKCPIIIYMDTNCDINMTMFAKLEKELKGNGWKIFKN